MISPSCIILFLSLLASHVSASFYLPGVAPYSYEQYEDVKLFVTKLTSTKTQIPYDYYALPYCKPKHAREQSENLGEVLSGDRIENSVYRIQMKVPKACEVACVTTLRRTGADEFSKAIDEEYRVHWIVDNLPVGVRDRTDDTFHRGFPIGFTSIENGVVKRYLNNHIRIIIQYHDNTAEENEELDPSKGVPPAKIVGFRVEPMSIHHTWNDERFVKGVTTLNTCNSVTNPTNDRNNFQQVKRGETVVFSYDVYWESSDMEWANRWDTYILDSPGSDKVHWFSITNSIMIVLFLTVMIAMILLRALRKDIASYNEMATSDEAREESGWKMCHGDVFRPPTTFPMLLSVFVGTGVQLICMSVATLTFSLLGLLSPDNRGSLTTAFILLFVFMGSFAGYHSSRTYKMFRGTEWKRATVLTALFYPGVVFVVYFTLNFALLTEGSSGAIPLSTFFTLLFLWFCVSVPLVFLGSFFGYKKEAPTHPVRTNQIPRLIPTQAWYLHPVITIALGGVLPFGAVSVELFFILSALWLHQIYYIFGFLFLVMIVLVVTCAEISILLCYFQLCNEDYHWWWRSFLTSGACAGYTFIYSIWYYMTELDLDGTVPILIYFGYMSVISLTFFLITGTIGFNACYWFNTQIYGSIKVD
mmetsp:Transcript_23891/g.35055  ORF Transcript_23891/g.35055 Transcript_23891/m.35055 type:complete len:644 (+) Transcript_23891:68-1999(+)|eukprot:CAMPEP_0185024500 /NCGR_PEP_ID=MMETSP1103-20130426/7585_1 /TAXON_ID=36769 /ORGANISM="Paraphysomonas bandaiensis, Strain Caron Lab Isolate" /LENGTH=643 /DNA_ID=CAMNT_0027557483 /DNA_START=50 /DNA_END=1981 /DNA_ORIENTATION=+